MHLTWVLSDLTELPADDDDSSECLLDVFRALKGSDEEDELFFLCRVPVFVVLSAFFFPPGLPARFVVLFRLSSLLAF